MNLPSTSEIRLRRKRLDLTQHELSKLSGLSQSLIAKIESGKAEASYEKIKRIFESLQKKNLEHEKNCLEAMSERIIGIKDSELIGKAANVMKKNNISQLPVFKGTIIAGSITESLILRSLEDEDKDSLFRKKVSEIENEPFPIVNGETPVKSIIPLLEHSSAILVSVKGEIKGIITKSDLL